MPTIKKLFTYFKNLPAATWLIIHFLIITFSGILIWSVEAYYEITLEDGPLEYLTACFAIVSAGVLFWAIRMKIQRRAKIVCVVAGIFMVFFAGEEISWGQRLFNFGTPEQLAEINSQEEFNIHDTNKLEYDRIPDRATILLALVVPILLLMNQKKFFYLPVPSAMLVLSFIAADFYKQYDTRITDFYLLNYVGLILLLIYAIKNKYRQITAMTVLTAITTLFIPALHILFRSKFGTSKNMVNEAREMLFALCCMCTSFYMVLRSKQNNG